MGSLELRWLSAQTLLNIGLEALVLSFKQDPEVYNNVVLLYF